MIAGGLGGTTGDLLMHSLDTVKTRQQGDPHIPPKYTSMSSSYSTILRQEGIRRGLYGGWVPAMLGSFPGTVIFFGTYEYSKRHLIDYGITPQVAYLTSGMFTKGIGTTISITDISQDFLPILLPPSYMSHPKFSRPDYNCKVASTIRSLSLAITIKEQPTLLEQ
jgi:hypothetical protein